MTTSLFTSERERRMWTWAAVVVAAIYATLGVAGRVAGLLRQRGLLDAVFMIGALLVLATVIAHARRSRPDRTQIVIALGVAATYLLMLVRMAIPEERTHLIEYGVVAVLIHAALTERAHGGRRVPAPAALALVATASIGSLDEAIQWALPDRIFDVRDLGFNVLAALMAVTASVVLRRRPGRAVA